MEDQGKYLSVSDFAKAVGVSNQAVYQQLNKRLEPYCKVIDNRKMLNIQAIQDVYKKSVDTSNQSIVNDKNQELVNQLKEHIKDLKNQLSVANADKQEKDKQINALTEQNKQLTDLLTQQQALHAGTIQTQLLNESNEIKQTKQKSIFSIFHRKEHK